MLSRKRSQFDLNAKIPSSSTTSYSPSPPASPLASSLPFEKKQKISQNINHERSQNWVKTSLLGQGSYGVVHLATSKTNNQTKIAIKSAEFARASSLNYEKRILSSLQSHYIVRCYGDEFTREKNSLGKERIRYNLLLEYCEGRSLRDLIEKNKRGLPENDVKLFARDILGGLVYIHGEKIIHCDIKPDNILLVPLIKLVRPNGYLAKLADFGLAIEKGSSEYGDGSGHYRGTPMYMSPEVITKRKVDYPADIWAFGCIVLEMLTGKTTWSEYGDDLDSRTWLYIIGKSDLIPKIPENLSEEAKDFLRKCFVKEVDRRMCANELLNHCFLTSHINIGVR